MRRQLALAAATLVVVTGLVVANSRAEEPATPAAAAAKPRQTCRLFPIDVDKDRNVDTGDRTTEVGKWVGEHEDRGYRLVDVDFEVGLKMTGYPQGYLHVCLER